MEFFFYIVPEEFMYNPLTRSYGEPHKRPEVQNSTVEFIASSDYMVKKVFMGTRQQLHVDIKAFEINIAYCSHGVY